MVQFDSDYSDGDGASIFFLIKVRLWLYLRRIGNKSDFGLGYC